MVDLDFHYLRLQHINFKLKDYLPPLFCMGGGGGGGEREREEGDLP